MAPQASICDRFVGTMGVGPPRQMLTDGLPAYAAAMKETGVV
jgi:hypothetical protein